MKIAIVSCYFINNYGSILQSFATQRYFSEKGFICDTVSVEGIKPYLNNEKKKYYIRNFYRLPLLTSKYPQAKLSLMRKINSVEKNFFKSRVDKFNEFKKNFSLVGESLTSLEKLSGLLESYDVAILGGDQLWRPDNILPGYYTLEWVPDKVKKVSFATSFGVSSLDKYSEKRAKHFLKRFDALSVREDSGCKIIEDLTGQKALQVCDPVFLLDKEEWGKIADTSYCPPHDYIFTYFLGNKRWHRKYAQKLSEKTGLPIVRISSLDSFMPMDRKVDYNLADASPEQFLGLIKRAKYVCTDSFHVTAFSTIFHGDFSVFKRHSGKKHATNGRLESFLKALSLEDRFVENKNTVCQSSIDYNDVDQKKETLIAKSKEFIEDFLK